MIVEIDSTGMALICFGFLMIILVFSMFSLAIDVHNLGIRLAKYEKTDKTIRLKISKE